MVSKSLSTSKWKCMLAYVFPGPIPSDGSEFSKMEQGVMLSWGTQHHPDNIIHWGWWSHLPSHDPDLAVCSTPFPSWENVDESEVEVTGCKDILWQVALVIMICGSLALRNVHGYMHSIQSAETSCEIVREMRGLHNFGQDGCIRCGELHEIGVRLFRCQDMKNVIYAPE